MSNIILNLIFLLLDVTLYKKGKRFTLNPNGNDAADSDLVWDLHQKQGCSVRVLRPHQYCQKVSTMLAHLEEEFGQGFGANTYLTPAGSQGFSPHWDDVEAFVLQLEGRKQWRIHAAREPTEILPRESSKNFAPDEVGDAIMTVWLEPGDLMYFPRGTIHQAVSAPETHSLHLTVSTGHQNTWADLFEKVVPAALQQAAEERPKIRESLPIHYGHYMGVMHSDMDNDERRKAFFKTATGYLEKIFQEFVVGQLDDAADQMMTKFLWDRQPPQSMLNHKELGVSKSEMEGISFGSAANGAGEDSEDDAEGVSDEDRMDADSGASDDENDGFDDEEDEITLDTKIRLVTRDCVRLAIEGDFCGLYYATTNEPNYHEVEPQKLKMPLDYAESIEVLWRSYPKYISCREFTLESDGEKLDLCKELVERQIVMLE
jgi:bifunctional lysine-specific demethylase and histidyl-hydroxylase NO66